MSLDMYLATIIVLCLSAFAGCTNITVSDEMSVTESMSVGGKHTAVVAAHEKTSHDIYIQDGKTGDGTAVAVEAAAEDTAEASVPTSDPPPSSSGGSNANSDSAAAAANSAAAGEGEKKSQEHTSSAGMGIALSMGCVLVTAAIGVTHL